MGKTSHTIAWEKWKDPFGEELKSPKKDDGWDKEYDAVEEDDVVDESHDTKVIITEMGAMPVLIHNSPSKIFNFWIGHTNFNISEKVVDIVAKTCGVESLDVFTPYRLRIAVARLFKPRDVMHRINLAVKDYLEKNKISTPWG